MSNSVLLFHCFIHINFVFLQNLCRLFVCSVRFGTVPYVKHFIYRYSFVFTGDHAGSPLQDFTYTSLPLEGKGDRLRWMRCDKKDTQHLLSRLQRQLPLKGKPKIAATIAPQGEGLIPN